MERVTTTRNFGGFRREDITFSSPRMQRQIVDELPKSQIERSKPDAPVSTTPEQVIHYYEQCIEQTQDMQEKHVYSQTIKWIKELESRKQAEIAEKVKSFSSKLADKADDSTLDDLEVE